MSAYIYDPLKDTTLPSTNDYQLNFIKDEEIEAIRSFRNDQINILRQNQTISKDEQKAYFNHVILPCCKEKKPKQILLSYHHQGSFIGYGGLVHINWNFSHAEVSFLVDPSRKDVYNLDFSYFLKLIASLAFSKLKLHRLFTETFSYRTNHISILEKSGFKKEGVLRQHCFKDNQWVDSIIHGMLTGEESPL